MEKNVPHIDQDRVRELESRVRLMEAELIDTRNELAIAKNELEFAKESVAEEKIKVKNWMNKYNEETTERMKYQYTCDILLKHLSKK